MTEVGSKVDKFKVGDKVAAGCLVGSCHSCQNCVNNLENYCQQVIPTYGAKYVDGTITYGGFSDFMVADEHFVVNIPSALPLDAAAPLLCAGITLYGPLRYFGLDKPGMHLGVVGLGRVGGALIGGGGCIDGSGIGAAVTLNKCIWACCKLRMRDSPRLLN